MSDTLPECCFGPHKEGRSIWFALTPSGKCRARMKERLSRPLHDPSLYPRAQSGWSGLECICNNCTEGWIRSDRQTDRQTEGERRIDGLKKFLQTHWWFTRAFWPAREGRSDLMCSKGVPEAAGNLLTTKKFLSLATTANISSSVLSQHSDSFKISRTST